MGRPKKADLDPVPTRDRILNIAIEQFARRGFDAVSIRDITRALGLNEASLYNHFESKADLLAAAFAQLEERLIAPGFEAAPPERFTGKEPVDLAEVLIAGSKRFFSAADRTVLLTWRILMMSQYAYPSARDSVRKHLLEAPCRFFTSVLTAMKNVGRIGSGVDCGSYGRIIAAVFFDYSFRSNLDAAWDEEDGGAWDRLCADLRSLCGPIAVGGGEPEPGSRPGTRSRRSPRARSD